MIRILIFIFSLNAFIAPASAMGMCDMMDESNSMMMSSSMKIDMSEMDCDMDTGTMCCSAQCASYCGVTSATPSLFFEKQTFFIVAGHYRPQAGFAYFYNIVHPINTPPPLV